MKGNSKHNPAALQLQIEALQPKTSCHGSLLFLVRGAKHMQNCTAVTPGALDELGYRYLFQMARRTAALRANTGTIIRGPKATFPSPAQQANFSRLSELRYYYVRGGYPRDGDSRCNSGW